MSTPVTSQPAAAPSRSWPLRIVGLVVGTALFALGFLAALGWMFTSLQPGRPVHPDVVAGLLLAVVVALVFLAWKRVRLLGTWPRVAVGAAVAAAGLTWLAWDDPAYRHAMTIEDLSGPAGPQAAESHEATLRYTERPGRPAATFTGGKLNIESPVEKPEAWRATIDKSRAELAAEWERLAPEREWLAAMDAFAAIGDDASAGFEAPVMRFAPFRRVMTVGAAEAAARALEGKGDEAVDILARQLSVCAKLERNSRTLLRSMVAIGGWRDGLAAADFVLEHSTVSPAQRARLAEVIAQREEHARVLHRIVWVDFVALRDTVLARSGELDKVMQSEMRAFSAIVPAMRPFIFLPRHTANLHGEFLTRIEELAQKRDDAGLKDLEIEFYKNFHVDGPKNFGGKYAISIATPAFHRPLQRSWEVEDLRQKLLAKLKA